ncbi:MAG TPA: hypothetical protein EYP85_08865 [Armatimonadetes bacterium]|nr:hypothetical protein [Armatimonadota bacterium]
MAEGSLEEKLRRVRLLALDVDGVLTDGRVWLDEEGMEFKSFDTRDGLGLRLARSVGIEVAFLTARASGVVEARAEELGITELYQGLTGDKAECLRELAARQGLELAEVAYMGDDLLDLTALRTAGVALAVADAVEEVKAVADYVTRRPGGRGAVREAVEVILRAQGLYKQAVQVVVGESVGREAST